MEFLDLRLQAMKISAPNDDGIGRKKGFELLDADRIEDRLENLKRKPTWSSFLMTSELSDDDEHVDPDWRPSEDDEEDSDSSSGSHDSDSDSEEGYTTGTTRKITGKPTPNTFLHALVWTPLVLIASPILLIVGCCSSSGRAKHG